MTRRTLLASVAVVVTGSVAAVPALAAATRVIVPIGDNYFGHDGHVHGVGAARGDIVRWVWTGTARHNVTVVKGPERFHSRTQRSGTYEHRVTRPGRYTIICTIHGRADQAMTLMVR